MSDSLVASVCGMYQLLMTYISCMLLVTTAEMNKTASPTCEDLACENSNVCQSSLVNNTHSAHPYCSCTGQWAGSRCELKLFVSAQSVRSQMVVLKLHGRLPTGHRKSHTSHDLFVSKVTVAVWNFNVSDQCLLLQQNTSAENALILTGLDRQQDYLVCVANGFVDSCLFFQQQPSNISKLSTCIYFETKLFDIESFDVGFVVVPSAVVMFIVVIIIFVYCQRQSLLIQLCLNKVCCRSCYCLRKHIQKRQCLTYRQSDVSGEMLMPGDVSTDFESVTEAHTRATEELNGRRTYSSNASSSPRRSACSLDPDGSALVPTSLDHNTFLYENQSLIPPLYSPQYHKVMTLTYIDDELIPLRTEQTVPNHTDTLFLEPYSLGSSQDQAHEDRPFTDSKTGCDILKGSFVIPASVMQKFTPNQIPDSILCKEITGSNQYTGPVKQHLLVHPYLHRPYHKNPILHRPNHSNQTPNQFSHNEHSVRFREPNHSNQTPNQFSHNEHSVRFREPNHSNQTPNQFSHNEHSVRFREPNCSVLRQRPVSLPVTHLCQDSSKIGDFQSSNHPKQCLKSPRKSSLRDTGESSSFLLPAWPTKFSPGNHVARCNSDTNNIKINQLLCIPTYHNCTMKESEQPCVSISRDNSCSENGTSNTLPRSKKPRFIQPFPRNSFQDSLLNSSFGNHQQPLITVPPKRPTWLNIPNPIQKPKSSNQTQETKFASAETSTPSESKSHSKQVRSLISHFEHSFMKSSKSNRPTEEEKEYQDLLSPLAAERIKASKKSRHSNSHKTSSGNKTTSSHYIHKRDSTLGPPIFEGHPSEHIILPFTTDNQEDGDDHSDTSMRNEASDRNSISSNFSRNGDSVISSFEGNDTNLVTPFDPDNSSDDDTYKDIQSLTGSNDTLQDLEAEQSLLKAEGTSSFEPPVLQNNGKINLHNEECEKLLNL